MNLAKLSKLDIKDLQKIDYKQLLQDLRKKPDLAICIVAGLLTVLFCLQTFSKGMMAAEKVKSDIRLMEEKNSALDAYNKSKSDLDEFLNKIPEPITENGLMDKITDLAVARNVQIESFVPTKNQNEPLYTLSSITLNVAARDYKNMWLFIHDIETSPYAIRIENWTGNMGPRSQSGRRREASNPNELWINVRVEVAAVNIKNEK